MKGTLFSADFVKDGEGNLRLLELNTDTAFTSGALAHTNFDSFINIISSSNISQVDVIYKERIHSNFVEQLSQSLHESSISPALNLHVEQLNSIYPSSIVDSSDKFILRCAYDESAIFDSTYCKQSDETLKLFYDNNDTGSIPSFYHSSSNYFVDTLESSVNGSTVPDLVIKGTTDGSLKLKFYKVPGTGSVEDNFAGFKSNLEADKFAVNFYNSSGSKSISYRAFNIIYGGNLDLINLANVEVESILSKPTTLSYSTGSGEVHTKHYYELTTNYPRFFGIGGLFEDDEITDAAGNPVMVKDTLIGNEYKSTYIHGAPDTDSVDVFTSWSSPGSTLPSGSYTTSSVLIGKIDENLDKNIVQHIQTAQGSSFRLNPSQHLLVYDSSGDELRYKMAYDLDTSIDRLIGASGSNVSISSSLFEVLELSHKTYILDLEPNDTFVLHNGDLNIKIVTHNCFPAGTKITLEDGSQKNIEEITSNDTLLTYNTVTKKFGVGSIESINKTTQHKLIKIFTSSGNEIESTPKHKFFCVGSSWTSAEELQIGDKLFRQNGDVVEVTNVEVINEEVDVFHIVNVKDDHTYFAEELLVHNSKFIISCFPAGTKITLPNGDLKNIEDIVVGDEVMSYDEKEQKQTSNKVYEVLTPIHNDIVKYTLSDNTEISSTFDHPFYVNGLDLASNYPEKTNSMYDIDKQVNQIKVGDVLSRFDGTEVEIISIEIQPEVDTQTYLLRVEENHNFYANNVLVHNK